MKPVTIYLIRHGQSMDNYNFDRAIQDGNVHTELESGLSELGEQQIRKLAVKLENIPFSTIYTSHLTRARETANILAEKIQANIIVEKSIRERVIGRRSLQDYKKLLEEIKKRQENLSDSEKMNLVLSDDMETEEFAVNRLVNFITKISPDHEGEKIIIVSHGNLMRMLLVKLGYCKYDAVPGGSVENGGIIILKTFNDTIKIHKTLGVQMLLNIA